MNKETRIAYAEIVEILTKMEFKYVEMIPIKMREYFTYNKSPDYKQHINSKQPLKEQNLSKKTINLLALLNMKYWTKKSKHKEKLMNSYKNNEILYREKYNPDNLFKNKQESTVIENTNLPVEIKKETFFKKLISFIKGLFNKTN